MRTVGPSHPCLLLSRGFAPGADGVILQPGDSPPEGLIHAVEIGDAVEVPARADLLVLHAREITHRPLIEACAVSGFPLALCTRGATLKEITRAVGWHQLAFRSADCKPQRGLMLEGGSRLIVVHGGGNLRAMARITSQTFGPVGYDDDGNAAGLAVAAGAVLLIRDGGAGFAGWAREVRAAERLLGDASLPQAPNGTGERRAIVAAREIAAGETLREVDFQFRARATGLPPYQAEHLAGRKAARRIAAGEPITEADVQGKPPEQPEWFSPRPPKAPPS